MYKSYCRCITGGLSQRHVHSRICRYNRSGSVTEEHVSEPSLSLTADRAALSPSQSANNFGEPGGLHRASRIRNALLDLTKWLRDFLPHPPRLGRDRDLQVTWHTLRGTRPSRVVQSPVLWICDLKLPSSLSFSTAKRTNIAPRTPQRCGCDISRYIAANTKSPSSIESSPSERTCSVADIEIGD